MPARAEIVFARVNQSGHVNNHAVNYLVETPSGVIYLVYDDAGANAAYKKSSDGGYTWTTPVSLTSGQTLTQLSVWYDRWSGIAAGLIHVAYTESGTDDTHYRTIDTESSDALSTDTIIFAGSSTAGGGCLSIARAVGGNVYCRVCIDAGAEGGFFRLPNANVPNGAWDAARTIDEAVSTNDQIIMLPDYTASDNQDMLAIFWDASADEISRKKYDDSANTWSETSIATSMLEQPATTSWPDFAIAPDVTGQRHILVAWSQHDAANADLRCWTITGSAITETSANVVLNSTDDQGICGISIDTAGTHWEVVYCGKSDGSETFTTAMNIYKKGSKDGGVTWGAETKLTNATRDIPWLGVVPRRYLNPQIVAFVWDQTVDEILINVPLQQPVALGGVGV